MHMRALRRCGPRLEEWTKGEEIKRGMGRGRGVGGGRTGRSFVGGGGMGSAGGNGGAIPREKHDRGGGVVAPGLGREGGLAKWEGGKEGGREGGEGEEVVTALERRMRRERPGETAGDG